VYYILKTQMVRWQEINLQAEMKYELSLEWRMKYDWWDSIPVKGLLPLLTFSIHADAPLVDNYYTGNELTLYSERLISIFQQAGVCYETFPVSIVNQKTGKEVSHHYKLFHLLEMEQAINVQESAIEESTLGANQVPEIRRLVLTDEFIKQGKMLVRIKEFRSLTLIRKDLKQLLEEANIIGCSFVAVEDFSLGLNSLLKKIKNRISNI